MAGTISLTVDSGSPPPPSWWLDETLHPEGGWQQYAAGSWTATSDARQQGASIYDASPTTGSGIFAYSGAALDQSLRQLFLMGGGHGDYSGNEIMALDLAADTPAWRVFLARSQPLGTAYDEGANGSGQFADDIGVNGRPAASHTSTSLQCANGKLLIGQLWGITNGAAGTQMSSAGFLIDAVTGASVAAGKSVATAGFNSGEGPAIALVESRDEYWGGFPGISNTTDPFTYVRDTTTGAVKATYQRGGALPLSAGQARFGSSGVACEIYPGGARPSLILTLTIGNGAMAAGWWLIDPAAPHQMWGPLTIDNTSGITVPADTTSTRTALHHLHGTDKIYLTSAPFDAGANLSFLQLTIPAGDTAAALAAATWSLSLVTPSVGITPPVSTDVKTYNRFHLIRDMGDGRPALVLVPRQTLGTKTPVYVLKMNADGTL